MEEENIQEVQSTNETTTSESKGFDFKKYGPIIGIGVAVIAVIAILISLFSGGPKKAVKKYVKAFNSRNAKKVVNCFDIAGMSLGYYINEDNFTEDDYNDFVEAYKEAKKEVKDEDKKEAIESFQETFDEMKEEVKSFKAKVKKFKEVKKLGKDLYALEVEMNYKITFKDGDTDPIDKTVDTSFIVYKGKIIKEGLFTGLVSAMYDFDF